MFSQHGEEGVELGLSGGLGVEVTELADVASDLVDALDAAGRRAKVAKRENTQEVLGVAVVGAGDALGDDHFGVVTLAEAPDDDVVARLLLCF